jgi:hypothetical protein
MEDNQGATDKNIFKVESAVKCQPEQETRTLMVKHQTP